MANINDTIKQVEKLNPELAAELKRYVKSHSYGLVYEQNLPDAIRLYTKTPAVGDLVNILPRRGSLETPQNRLTWVIKSIDKGSATLERDGKTTTKKIDDLAVVVGYKDVIYPGLKEVDRIESGEDDDPYQVVINAENYHALEVLGYSLSGQVDVIYIDPPYNTGAKDWKYNNNYVDRSDRYRHSGCSTRPPYSWCW